MGFSRFGDMGLKISLRTKDGQEQKINVHLRDCAFDCYDDGWFTVLMPEYEKIERVARYVTSGRNRQDFYLFDRALCLPALQRDR